MGTVRNKIINNLDSLQRLIASKDVKALRLFGSVACGKDHKKSDLDLLVRLKDRSTLFEYGQLKSSIEEILNVETDMLTYSSLNENVLKHFIEHSITLDQLINEEYLESSFTEGNKLMSNLNSMIWVIDRITSQCHDVTMEEFNENILLQDFATRNIQLLGQIVSQLPCGLKLINQNELDGIVALRDALFMAVDLEKMYLTISFDLVQLKERVIQEIDHLS